MTIAEMRERLNVSRAEFSRRYNIPIRTLENWESEKSKCPDYVRQLLERAVLEDCEVNRRRVKKGGINMATEAQKRAIRKYENSNYRLNIVFPKGTKERIEKLGLGKSNSAFIRDVVLSELDRLEKK